MTTGERDIRTLIERWADAVHRGDMDGALAHHAVVAHEHHSLPSP